MRDKAEEKVAIENAKLKLHCIFNNTALWDSSIFLQHQTMETWGLWIFSAKCDVILRFRWISFNDAPRFYPHS